MIVVNSVSSTNAPTRAVDDDSPFGTAATPAAARQNQVLWLKLQAISNTFSELPNAADIVLAGDRKQRAALAERINLFGQQFEDLTLAINGLPENHQLRAISAEKLEFMRLQHLELKEMLDLFCQSHGCIPSVISHPSHRQERLVFGRLRDLYREALTALGLPQKPKGEHCRISIKSLREGIQTGHSTDATSPEVKEAQQLCSHIEKLRDYLLQANRGLAYGFVKNFTKMSIAPMQIIADLKAAAMMGLVKAIDDFDLARGCVFSTYADYHINNEVIHEVKRLRPKGSSVSLDESFGDDACSLKDLVPDTRSPAPDVEAMQNELKQGKKIQRVKDAIESLRLCRTKQTETAKAVIIRLYGLDGEPPQEMPEIAKELGITRNKAEAAKQLALRAVRIALRST